jgi:hypothetical protein
MNSKIIDLDELIKEGTDGVNKKWASAFLTGDTYKNYATLIVLATRGKKKHTFKHECPKCEHPFESEHDLPMGLHPWVVESQKRMIRPMNSPIYDMTLSGHEVGEAYCVAIEQFLTNDALKSYQYVLFCEDDILIPVMPDSYGPMIELYKHMDKYDVASGLYWTKGEPSLPLVYGDGDIDNPVPFSINTGWKAGDVVEVNGCGMGFALMKRKIFEDPRLEKPYFKSVNEMQGMTAKGYTQDLYFYEHIRRLGYRIVVDTSIRLGHLDITTERVF